MARRLDSFQVGLVDFAGFNDSNDFNETVGVVNETDGFNEIGGVSETDAKSGLNATCFNHISIRKASFLYAH